MAFVKEKKFLLMK